MIRLKLWYLDEMFLNFIVIAAGNKTLASFYHGIAAK